MDSVAEQEHPVPTPDANREIVIHRPAARADDAVALTPDQEPPSGDEAATAEGEEAVVGVGVPGGGETVVQLTDVQLLDADGEVAAPRYIRASLCLRR